MGKPWIPHVLALGIVALAAFALPGNLKVMELAWLRGQASLWFCGPTAGGLQSDWIDALGGR
ncbi:MAG: hypothetical protein ACE5DS_01265 [Kiloniellaceae bacterium]